MSFLEVRRLPTRRDVLAAAARLRGTAHRTPVATSRTLDRRAGASVFLKCENLQRGGAFKFRGAYNAMSRLPPAAKRRGVVAYSSGNHAQAVALAGSLLGVSTTVVMPVWAPEIKRAAAAGYGARIVTYDPATEDRREVADELAAAEGLTLIPPFDHPHIVAGQGTAALELVEAVQGLDELLVPCGGGGLLSGSALAVEGGRSRCRVVGVEPEGADDATRSFRSGALVRIDAPRTMADGLRTPSLGELTFRLILERVDGMETVSETAIAEAMRFAFYRLKLVVEPSGAVGLAALLSGAVAPRGAVGVILSGGNVDGATMARVLAAGDPTGA